MLLWACLSFIMGVPFPAAGLAAGLMARKRGVLIPLGMLIAVAMGFLMGPQAGVMTVFCASSLAVCLRLRVNMHMAIAVTSAATILGASLPVDPSPVFMSLRLEDMEPLTELYVDMGMERSMIEDVFSTMEYLSPGMGAIQISLGCIATVLFLSAGKSGGFGPHGRFIMGWQTAWVIIACLAVRVFAGSLPAVALRIADNVLLFMALPYLLEGGAVVLKWASSFPGMTAVMAVALVLATPVMLSVVALTGVLDTWFDFRRRMDMKVERLDE